MNGLARYLIVALAGIVLVACSGGSPPPPPTSGAAAALDPAGTPPPDTVVIVHWAAGHTVEILQRFAEAFNSSEQTVASGKRIQVIVPPEILSMVQTDMLVDAIQSGQVRDAQYGSPTIVTPTVDFWLAEVNYRTDRTVVDLARTQDLAVAWTGIAMYREMAECLGWPRREIGYADIVALRTDPRGWASLPCAKAAWGQEPLMSWTDPSISGTARSVLFGLYSVAAGKPTDQLTVEDIHDPKAVEYVKRFQQGVDHYVPGSMLLKTKMIAVYSHIYWVAEDVIFEVNDPRMREERIMADAPPGTQVHPLAAKGMVFIYPKEGSVPQNQPAGIVQAPWVSAEQEEAARIWIDYLREPPQQEAFMAEGFRPSIAIPYKCPICTANGLDPNKPTRVLKPVKPEVAAAIVGAWGEVKKPGIVVFVADTSASMSGAKLEEAKKGLVLALDALSANTSVGLIAFSDQVNLRVAVAPTQSSKFQIAKKVQELSPAGSTALYDALAEAIKMADAAPGPEDAIRGVVLMTDGRATTGTTYLHDLVGPRSRVDEQAIGTFFGWDGNDSGTTQNGKTVTKKDIVGNDLKIQTKHSIKIFYVGIGQDADYEIGRILAEATKSAYYETTEASLAAVLESFGKYF